MYFYFKLKEDVIILVTVELLINILCLTGKCIIKTGNNTLPKLHGPSCVRVFSGSSIRIIFLKD